MPRGTRKDGTLARLERQLAEVNELRERIISHMALALKELTFGSAASMAGLNVTSAIGRPRRGRAAGAPKPKTTARKPMSAATRKKMADAAKKRWAEAKKAGKKTLG